MDSEGDCFPYGDREDVIYFEEEVEDSGQFKQKPDVELYRRFPWLQFKNPGHKKKYIYQGRDTEQVSPFFIRFNLSQVIEVGSPQQAEDNTTIDDKLRQVVQGVIDPEGLAREKRLVEGIIKMNERAGRQTLYTIVSVHHGYLLTGIARPSTTANDAFDALFITLPHSKQPLPSSDSNRTELKGSYNVMKLNWQYKYHSYEYFSFMSRAYRELSKALRCRLREEEVEQAVSQELFNYNRTRMLRYLNSRQMSQAMNETEYFNFFSKLFTKHHQYILQQIGKHPHLKDGRMVLEIDGRQHQLREFQYQTYLKRQFEGVQLQQQALNKMIEHNRKRNKSIIENYPFKTRRDRVQQLNTLSNADKQVYNRIDLLHMTDLREHTPPGQQNRHFLIFFRMDERPVPACTLRQVIDRRIGTNNSVTVKMYKERLFQDLYRQENEADKYPLLNYFSCSPEGLLLVSNIIVPNFKKALEKYLQLDKLPLTHEQELLECTPSEDINIYEKLQELVEEYEYCQKEDAMGKLYAVLNDERFDFCPYDSSEEVRMDVGSARLKMKLLQLSMIEYELTNNCRCLQASTNGQSVPYNTYTPQHYKELKQYLAILLVDTNIINDTKITKRPTDTPKAIQDITKIYRQNCKQYLRYIEANVQRPFFSQVNQDAFRKTIQDFFKDLQESKLPGFNQQTIKQALRISHRIYLIIEVIEARVILSRQTSQYANQEIIADQLKNLHPFISNFVEQDKKEDRPKVLLNLKEQNPRFYAELKESLAIIKKELAECHQLFRHHPLRSKQGLQLLRGPSPLLQSSIGKLNGFSLLWLSAIFRDIMKYQQSDDYQKLLTLYKILMCFCCHLPQFHRNQVLQHEIKASQLTSERLQEKIYTFKNILLTQLAGFMVRNPEKYFGQGRNK